jgi:hypothetical protein
METQVESKPRNIRQEFHHQGLLPLDLTKAHQVKGFFDYGPNSVERICAQKPSPKPVMGTNG